MLSVKYHCTLLLFYVQSRNKIANKWKNEFIDKWMNKLMNIGQYRFIGNCDNFEIKILIRKLLNVEVFIIITNLTYFRT